MKNTDIVVLGTGQLGEAFKRLTNYAVLGRATFQHHLGVDQKTKTNLLEVFDCYNPKVLINCIGKSDTRWCENPNNYRELISVNSDLPGIFSDACRVCGVKYVHISTGCLYDIPDTPQKETDFLVSHCRYTLSKWLGECNCNSSYDLIVRPRLYFSPVFNNNNLLVKLPKFDRYTNKLDSIASVDVIVHAINALIANEVTGPVNVACDGYTSMKQIADYLKFGQNKGVINSTELRETNGLYLVNSVMDLTRLKKYYTPPTWQDEVARCWKALHEKDSV